MSLHFIGQRFRLLVSRGGCWQCVPDCRSRLAEVLTLSQVAYNERIGDQRMDEIKTLNLAHGVAEGYIIGFKSGLRFARDRFSAPPAIDVENIMEVVRQWVAGQLGMTPENEHWKDEEWQAAVPDLRSRLLSLLSPGKGDGVTVAENKAPRS